VVILTPDSPIEGDSRTESEETVRCVRVEATVEIPPGAEVQLTIHYKADGKSPVKSQVVSLTGGSETTRKHISFDLENLPVALNLLGWVRQAWGWMLSFSTRPDYLFVGALLVYFLLRLIRLQDFPIFFFTDEAVHTIQAADLVHNGFTGAMNEFLPTFFKNGGMYNLGVSVYLQVIPVLLGTHSVFMTRLVSVTVTLLAAASLGLIFAQAHNEKRGWLAILILSIIPAWFYHSRTAFETAEAVSFYAVFLLGYLKYRNGDFRWLYVSLVAAVLSFYSYSPARVVIAVLGVCLLVSDARFHWGNRKKFWLPLLIGVILSLPYFRFLYLHPGENQHHLELLGSYWIKPEPLSWKLLEFLKVYIQGLNPVYWFLPNTADLPRHIMKGMGHLGWYFLPFFAGGLLIALKKWKDPNYRLMLLALIAAPTGAAVAMIGITRALFMVIPATFFICIGLDYGLDWIRKVTKIQKPIDTLVFLLLAVINVVFLDTVLTEGPLWFTDYGMGGMQYGGEQVFGRINEMHKKDPNLHINLSPDWANGADVLARFHMGDPVPIEMSSMDAYINEIRPFAEDTVFVMPPDDFRKVINSGKFDPMQVTDVIFYPDGTPGFIFAHLKYTETARLAFEHDKSSRNTLDAEQVNINGLIADAASSRLDMGGLQSIFDNDPATLIRSVEANPLVVEIIFPQPRKISTVSVLVGGSATQVSVYAMTEGSDKPYATNITVGEEPLVRKVDLPLHVEKSVTRLRLEIETVHDGEPNHVHLWDVSFE